MIRPFDTVVNIDGTDFEIVLEGSDIQLQSLKKTIILTGAKDDLMEICEEYLRKSTYENGRPASYSREMIEEEFNAGMAEYAYDLYKTGIVLNHELN